MGELLNREGPSMAGFRNICNTGLASWDKEFRDARIRAQGLSFGGLGLLVSCGWL